MSRWKRLCLVVLMILACTGCDQATKVMAKQFLPKNQIVSLLKDTIRLHYVHNSGAFLGLGASMPRLARTAVFTLGVGVVVVGIFIYLLTVSALRMETLVGLSLICGGGFGNLIDRVAYQGEVVDFLNVGIGSLRTGIFNIADVAVLVGALVILWERARARRNVDPTLS